MLGNFLPRAIAGVGGFILSSMLALIVSAYTGGSWPLFAVLMVAQAIAAVLSWRAHKSRGRGKRKGWRKLLKLTTDAQNILKIGCALIVAWLLNSAADAVGLLPGWTTVSWFSAIALCFYTYWALISKRFSTAQLIGQFVSIVIALSVLVMSSAPYDAVGDVAYEMVNRAGMLTVTDGLGFIGSGVRAITRVPQHLATAVFLVSTYFQLNLLWVRYETDEEYDAALAKAGAAYLFEMVLSVKEYPFILTASGAPVGWEAIKQALEMGVELSGLTFGFWAFLACIGSVSLLDIAVGGVLQSAGIKIPGRPSERKTEAEPETYQREQRRTQTAQAQPSNRAYNSL